MGQRYHRRLDNVFCDVYNAKPLCMVGYSHTLLNKDLDDFMIRVQTVSEFTICHIILDKPGLVCELYSCLTFGGYMARHTSISHKTIQ